MNIERCLIYICACINFTKGKKYLKEPEAKRNILGLKGCKKVNNTQIRQTVFCPKVGANWNLDLCIL